MILAKHQAIADRNANRNIADLAKVALPTLRHLYRDCPIRNGRIPHAAGLIRLDVRSTHRSHKIEFNFLNANLMVPATRRPYIRRAAHRCAAPRCRSSHKGVTAMKKLITLAALATVIATPALAASYKTTEHASPSYHYVVSSPVSFDGKQVGQDPDANVRLMLLRDAQAGID
jgi:hypothetical protein